jgi:hypothetical protein
MLAQYFQIQMPRSKKRWRIFITSRGEIASWSLLQETREHKKKSNPLLGGSLRSAGRTGKTGDRGGERSGAGRIREGTAALWVWGEPRNDHGVMERRGKEERSVPERSTWEMDESPWSPCLASPWDRAEPHRVQPIHVVGHRQRLLPLSSVSPAAATANARVRSKVVSLSLRAFLFHSQVEFFSGPWEWAEGGKWMRFFLEPAQLNSTLCPNPFFWWATFFRLENLCSGSGMA